MRFRPLMPTGLALVMMTGCQSYFPYGYGNSSPYPPVTGPYPPAGSVSPGGTRSPGSAPSGGQFPTPNNSNSSGQMNLNSGTGRAQPAKGRVPDARFSDPGNAPTSLGAPASEDEEDSIKGGRSSLDAPGKRIEDLGDDADPEMSSADDERYVSPAPFRPASATSDDFATRRSVSKPRSSPYKKDPNGYTWLRGVVAFDPK